MTDICLGFEVHQPFRFRRNFYWDHLELNPAGKEDLMDYYFDLKVDRDIFLRACERCYLPSNRILLEEIDAHRREGRKVKVCFSLSGIFLEQCEMWNIDLLDIFRQLAETGCVEFLEQTYYHSLSSLWKDREEWLEQIRLHNEAMKDLLGVTPKFFENTELLYNNAIAKEVEDLGYKGIITEGVDRILGCRSPNYVYKPINCANLRLLLRNYTLTDDFGFRFSSRYWPEWPLTAEKYAGWLASTSGQCINLFADYETFGEHHWPESGIHEFLRHLPKEILKWEHLRMKTPSEIVESNQPVGTIDVSELDATISWADLERDTSCWLENTMQWAFYDGVQKLEPIIKECQDKDLTKIWRYLQTGDHLYYISTKGGGAGEVHSYFSPYGSPFDAFLTCINVLLDFKARVYEEVAAASSPFYIEDVEKKAWIWSLKGLKQSLEQITPSILMKYVVNGDIARWIRDCIGDPILAEHVEQLSVKELKPEQKVKELERLLTQKLESISRSSRLKRHVKGLKIEEAVLSRSDALRILRRLPSWKSFWFSKGLGLETGISASSLEEFAQRIGEVDEESIKFHTSRGDFERWIKEAIGDVELANKVNEICRSEASTPLLRKRLHSTVKERYEAIRRAAGI